MHFHLPKPLHGWREFAGEIGIIVIGVLIALTAEQVVERVHEHHEVDQMRRALRGELADSRARWEDMRAGHDCALKRLAAVEQWLRTAPPAQRLIDGYQPMLWGLHSSTWDTVKTSPATEHIPLAERLLYANFYAAIDNWRDYLKNERDNAVQLSALLATADQPEHRREAALRIDIARQSLKMRQRNYPYFFSRFDQLGIEADASQLTIAHNSQALCAPLQKSG